MRGEEGGVVFILVFQLTTKSESPAALSEKKVQDVKEVGAYAKHPHTAHMPAATALTQHHSTPQHSKGSDQHTFLLQISAQHFSLLPLMHLSTLPCTPHPPTQDMQQKSSLSAGIGSQGRKNEIPLPPTLQETTFSGCTLDTLPKLGAEDCLWAKNAPLTSQQLQQEHEGVCSQPPPRSHRSATQHRQRSHADAGAQPADALLLLIRKVLR